MPSSSSSCSSSSFSSSSSSHSRRPVTQMAGDGLAGDTLYTHLNLTGDQRATLSEFGGPTFVYDLSESVSDRLVKVLQDFFQATTIGKNFNYELGKVHKEVVIHDQFVGDVQRLPQIVVTAVPAETLALSFGNRLGQENYGDQQFNVYGGKAVMNTTLELYDSGKPNVKKLADIVLLAFMQYVVTHMGATMMNVDSPKLRFTSASLTTGTKLGGEVYLVRITVPISAEWRQFMEVETVSASSIRALPSLASSSCSSLTRIFTRK